MSCLCLPVCRPAVGAFGMGIKPVLVVPEEGGFAFIAIDGYTFEADSY